MPVAIRSPGSSVIVRLIEATSSATPNTICAVLEDWSSRPFRRSRIASACGSGISSAVTSHGPHGRNVSIALPSIHWEVRFCRSRAETSFMHV